MGRVPGNSSNEHEFFNLPMYAEKLIPLDQFVGRMRKLENDGYEIIVDPKNGTI